MKVVQVDGTTCSKSGNKQEQGKEVQITEDWGIRESRETRALKLEGTEIRDRGNRLLYQEVVDYGPEA